MKPAGRGRRRHLDVGPEPAVAALSIRIARASREPVSGSL
jgi:hypothetical protein